MLQYFLASADQKIQIDFLGSHQSGTAVHHIRSLDINAYLGRGGRTEISIHPGRDIKTDLGLAVFQSRLHFLITRYLFDHTETVRRIIIQSQSARNTALLQITDNDGNVIQYIRTVSRTEKKSIHKRKQNKQKKQGLIKTPCTIKFLPESKH